MAKRGFFGARAAVAAMACMLAVAVVVLVALAEADRAGAAVPGKNGKIVQSLINNEILWPQGKNT